MRGGAFVQPIPSLLAPCEWSFGQGPRRRHTLALLRAGAGVVAPEGAEVPLDGAALVWVPAGARAVLRLRAGASGQLLSLSDEVLSAALGLGAATLDLADMASGVVVAPLAEAPGVAAAVDGALASVRAEQLAPDDGSATVVVAQVAIALIAFWRKAGLGGAAGAVQGFESGVLHRFRNLVELHVRDHWPVARYAEALRVTPDRLHAICTRKLGRAPKRLVHDRLLHEAKGRLERSSMTIDQIAFELGFRDRSYFNRFFRDRAGTTPAAWRRRAAGRAPGAAEGSFADWP